MECSDWTEGGMTGRGSEVEIKMLVSVARTPGLQNWVLSPEYNVYCF